MGNEREMSGFEPVTPEYIRQQYFLCHPRAFDKTARKCYCSKVEGTPETSANPCLALRNGYSAPHQRGGLVDPYSA